MEWVYKCMSKLGRNTIMGQKKPRQTALHASIKLIPVLSNYIEKSSYTSR